MGLGGPHGLTAVSGGWCWLPAGHLHSLLHQDAMGQLLHLVDQLSDRASWRSQGAKAEAPPSLQSPALKPTRGSYVLLANASHRASPDARRWRNRVHL